MFFEVTNHNMTHNITLAVPCGDFHSPWNLGDPSSPHLRLDVNAGPLLIDVPAGATTPWIDVGALLTTQVCAPHRNFHTNI